MNAVMSLFDVAPLLDPCAGLAKPVTVAREAPLSVPLPADPFAFVSCSCPKCGSSWQAFADSPAATRCDRCAVAGRTMPKYAGK